MHTLSHSLTRSQSNRARAQRLYDSWPTPRNRIQLEVWSAMAERARFDLTLQGIAETRQPALVWGVA